MQYDLVFEGGGAKGIVFAGALQAFEEKGHRHGRLLGTSAGAVAGTLVAAGYSVDEFRSVLSEKGKEGKPVMTAFLGRPRPPTREELESSSLKTMLDEFDVPVLPNFIERMSDRLALSLLGRGEAAHLFSLLEWGGWYAADGFIEWLRRALSSGRTNGRQRDFADMNLLDFYLSTGKDLSIIAADITNRRMLVLNHTTAPQCPLVWAVRMSMGIPFLWQEVVWQSAWGNYLGREMVGSRVVDGGLLSNFPIELFMSRDPYVVSLMGPTTSDGVLGLLIDEQLPVPQAFLPSNGDVDSRHGPMPLPTRIAALVDTALNAHDKMVLEAFESKVCRLPAAGYGTTEFDMSDLRREALINAGYAAAERYFKVAEQGAKDMPLLFLERDLAAADRRARAIFAP